MGFPRPQAAVGRMGSVGDLDLTPPESSAQIRRASGTPEVIDIELERYRKCLINIWSV